MEATKRIQKLLALKKSLGVFSEPDEEEARACVARVAAAGHNNIYHIAAAGAETVSNAQLSAAHGHAAHSVAASRRRAELRRQLEEEEAEMQKKFEEVANKWRFNAAAGPLHLFEEILSQKQLCGEILTSKNCIIDLLEDEQRAADEDYKDLISDFSKVKNELNR